MYIPPHSCHQHSPPKAKTWCGLHTEEEAGTHLGTEATGGIGGAVHCSARFHWALDGPRCVQAAPVVQGQAVLGGWRWRWRECRERWGYKSLLTASTILRALSGEREKRKDGVKAKVAVWRNSTVSFTESITRLQRAHFPRSLSLKVIQAWILYFHLACVRERARINACMYLHPPPIKYSLQPHLLLRVRCLHALSVVQRWVSNACTRTRKRLCTQGTSDTRTPMHVNAPLAETNYKWGSSPGYSEHIVAPENN